MLIKLETLAKLLVPIYSSIENKNKIINTLCESFEGDTLKVARVPESDLSIKESIAEKLKSIATVLAAAIHITISIIQFMQLQFHLLD